MYIAVFTESWAKDKRHLPSIKVRTQFFVILWSSMVHLHVSSLHFPDTELTSAFVLLVTNCVAFLLTSVMLGSQSLCLMYHANLLLL